MEGGSSTKKFERWIKGTSGNKASLSEEGQCRGPPGRAPLLGTLEDVLRKAPDTVVSLHGGVLYVRGEPRTNREGGSCTGDVE